MGTTIIVAKPELHSAILRCPAEGIPEPSISWLMNGQPFSERSYGKVRLMMRQNSTKAVHLVCMFLRLYKSTDFTFCFFSFERL